MSNELSSKPPIDILIATDNRFKKKEMEWYLTGLPFINLHYLSELPFEPKIDEDGKTVLDNARKKAAEISLLPETTNWLVYASDFGADIPFLNGWDATRPKRMMGEAASEEERARNLIERMQNLQGEERIFHYLASLAFAKSGKVLWAKQFRSYSAYITDNPDYVDIGKDRAMGRLIYLPRFNQTEDRLTEVQQNELRLEFQTDVKREVHEWLMLYAA